MINKETPYGQYYTKRLTGVRKGTKIKDILLYIYKQGPSRKYSLVTKVLGKKGTRKELRGYYSDNMRVMINCGLLDYNCSTYEYSITEYSIGLLLNDRLI